MDLPSTTRLLDRYLTRHINPTFFAHAFKAIVRRYHEENLPVLRQLIQRDSVVFDIGAHAGQYTKIFAEIADRGFVFAIEPGSYARLILRAVMLLRRARNVAVLPMALGEQSTIQVLNVPVKPSGSYGFGLSHLGRADRLVSTRSELVAVATLDDIVAALGLDRLDFIKADIEGWELHAIRGGLTTLRRFKPTLLFEMNERHLSRAGHSLSEAWETLCDLGYLAHELRGGEMTPVHGPREGDIVWRASSR